MHLDSSWFPRHWLVSRGACISAEGKPIILLGRLRKQRGRVYTLDKQSEFVKSVDLTLVFRKQERLIRAWEFELADGTQPLIFETEDGCLWQFCDVGLGWTYYYRIEPDWKENEIIQQYLPANINPRPKDCKRWNYEFRRTKKAVLRVKPGNRERSFKWGMRTGNKNHRTRRST